MPLSESTVRDVSDAVLVTRAMRVAESDVSDVSDPVLR